MTLLLLDGSSRHVSSVDLTAVHMQERGFADVVYLDAKTDTYLEEVSSCNIFIVQGKTVKTPALTVCPPGLAGSACSRGL